MMRNVLVKILTLLWLVSCATVNPLDGVRHQLDGAPACCTSYAQFKFEPLSLVGSESATLGNTSPAYNFDSGKSYFKAYRLPESRRPYSITVRSIVVERKSRSEVTYL
ncbi:MAG: hypothetical protein ACREUV_04900, partial [Burkholderiales bacterium]